MAESLPPRPDLQQIKRQAKDILKAHQAGDASCCGVLRTLNRLRSLGAPDILATELQLKDVQFALGMHYGFESWAALKAHVQAAAGEKAMSAVVYGRVTAKDGGQPIEGAEVRVELNDDMIVHRAYARVHTDAAGAYRCDLTWTGDERQYVHWQCRHCDYKFDLGWPREEDAAPAADYLQSGDRREINIQLHDGYAVELTVQDEQGAPVSGAEVFVFGSDGLCLGPFMTDYITGRGGELAFPKTDAQGQCFVNGLDAAIPDGYQYVANIMHDDFISQMVTGIDKLARHARVARATIRLERGHSLSGQVRCATTGRPIADASVIASRALDEDEAELRDWGSAESKEDTTGSDGRFTLKGLRDRPHQVRVRHSMWLQADIGTVDVPSDRPLVVELVRGRAVTGEVVRRDGSRAGGAEIYVCQEGKSFVEFNIMTRADRQGRFELGGLPTDAAIYLVARDDDGPCVYFGFTSLDADQDHVVLDARELVEVTGRVIDPSSGDPVSVPVACRAQGRFPHGVVHLCEAALSELPGEFRLLLPANGDVALCVHASDDVFTSPFMTHLDLTMRDGHPDRPLEIPATPSMSLVLRALDARTDRPIVRAGVEIVTESEHWGLAYTERTGPDGRAKWDCLPPCDVRIDVIAEGYEALREHHIKMPTDEEVVIRLGPEAKTSAT